MKYKVIVADDEDVIRKGIVYLIDWDKLNCEIVQECTDGLQVLKYLEKNTADIVITDIKMSKLSGIAVSYTHLDVYKRQLYYPYHDGHSGNRGILLAALLLYQGSGLAARPCL